MNNTWKLLARLVGSLGITALVFGLIVYLLDSNATDILILNLILALVGIIVYAIVFSRSIIMKLKERSSPLWLIEVIHFIGLALLVIAINSITHLKDGPFKALEWDLTRDNLFGLEEQSLRIIRDLKTPIEVVGYFRPTDNYRKNLTEAVLLYQKHSPLIQLRFQNPDTASPEELKKYDLGKDEQKIIIHTEDGRFTKIRYASEESLTNAFLYVAQREEQFLFVLEGHQKNELSDLNSAANNSESGYGIFLNKLNDEGIKTKPLLLLEEPEVPSNANALWISAGDSALSPNETEAILRYLDRSGNLLITLEPNTPLASEKLLETLGVHAQNDRVLDTQTSANFGPETLIVRNYVEHLITKPMQQAPTVFQLTRSLLSKNQAGVKTQSLILTSNTSYSDGPIKVPGPLPIALAVEKSALAGGHGSRAVITGDQSFLSNRFILLGGNKDLALNIVHFIQHAPERIVIRPKMRGASKIPLTQAQNSGILFFSVNLFPLLLFGLGMAIFQIRRSR